MRAMPFRLTFLDPVLLSQQAASADMSSHVTPSASPSIVSCLEGDMALQREQLQNRTNETHADVVDPQSDHKRYEKSAEF